MSQRIGLLTLLVADYDEAIAYYTEKLKFCQRGLPYATLSGRVCL
jgi:catechol 2,3-dioxygenase-like lactoylglutathione lyase family enzyme